MNGRTLKKKSKN